MNTNNIHLILIFLALLLGPIIVLKLSLQPRNNILDPGLAFLKREVPAPIPPSRFLIRFQRCPFP